MSLFTHFRRFLIIIVVLLSASGCRTVPVHGAGHVSARVAAMHRYYYYPDIEVYFDIERNVYFYFTDGIWRVAARLPYALRVHVGPYVSLELDTVEPYKYLPRHRRNYPHGYFKRKHKRKHHDKGLHRGEGHYKGKGKGHDNHEYDEREEGHKNGKGHSYKKYNKKYKKKKGRWQDRYDNKHEDSDEEYYKDRRH